MSYVYAHMTPTSSESACALLNRQVDDYEAKACTHEKTLLVWLHQIDPPVLQVDQIGTILLKATEVGCSIYGLRHGPEYVQHFERAPP